MHAWCISWLVRSFWRYPVCTSMAVMHFRYILMYSVYFSGKYFFILHASPKDIKAWVNKKRLRDTLWFHKITWVLQQVFHICIILLGFLILIAKHTYRHACLQRGSQANHARCVWVARVADVVFWRCIVRLFEVLFRFFKSLLSQPTEFGDPDKADRCWYLDMNLR